MIRTVLLNTGSLLNIEWIWHKYSLFTDGPYFSCVVNANAPRGVNGSVTSAILYTTTTKTRRRRTHVTFDD